MQLNTDVSRIKVNRRLEPFINILVETPRYLLKTVDQFSEFNEVLKLRADVFFEEYGIEAAAKALDIDEFDFQCDHLMIIDRQKQKIVGTYRVLCSKFTDHFYSETEFDLKNFIQTKEIKLELGRACISLEHRRGAVLNLLWKGILQYAQKMNARYLFGCSSVKTESFSEAKSLCLDLKIQGAHSNKWNIQTTPEFSIPEFSSIEPKESFIELPPLLRSYLKAGAKVHGDPAYDASFHCHDFLTILDLKEMSSLYEKKYFT